MAILGGDPVVGQALEVLVQGMGYGARFLSEPVVERPGELLASAGLLLLAPAPSAGLREALLDSATDGPGSEVPVLELLSTREAAAGRGWKGVFWPCSAEKLREEIQRLLAARDAMEADPDINCPVL